jgi:ATP-dependent Zn protease
MPPDPSSMPVTRAYVEEWQARLAHAHKGVSDEIARVKELIDRHHARTLEALNEQKRQLDEMVEEMMKTNDEHKRKGDEIAENAMKMVEPHN